MVNEVERGFYNAGLFGPCLANSSASLFPTMFVWALTLRMVILWWEVFSVYIIRVMRSLSGWLYWEDEVLMWLKRRYMMLRLFVNVNDFKP